MAVSTQTDIANMAARILGEENTGGALSSTSNYAINRALEDRIDAAKREVLAAHPWGFASKLKVLRTKADIATVTGITAASPPVVTYTGTDYFANGDRVELTDVVGMTEVNGNVYIAASVNTTSNTFALTDENGDNIDGTGFTAYTSGGKARLLPAFGFSNKYDLPSDFVRVVDINDGDAEPSEWEIVGTQILTDLANPELRYVYDITITASAPDDLFNRSLALYLAWDIARFILQDDVARARLFEDYRQSIAQARFIESSQHGAVYVKNNGALLSRLGDNSRDLTKVWRNS